MHKYCKTVLVSKVVEGMKERCFVCGKLKQNGTSSTSHSTFTYFDVRNERKFLHRIKLKGVDVGYVMRVFYGNAWKQEY